MKIEANAGWVKVEPDLTSLTTPFGLLDRETQEALKAHGGPYEYYSEYEGWRECVAFPALTPGTVYRVKPAPPKPREWWINAVSRTVVLHKTYESANEGRRNSRGEIVHGYEADPIHVREVLPETN